MKRFWLVFISLLLLGCGTGSQEVRPDDVFDEDKFVAVMIDVQLLEATSRKKLIRDGDPKGRISQFYGQLFAKHQITQEEFERTYRWWNTQPEKMIEVYEKVLENLSRLEEETKPGKVD